MVKGHVDGVIGNLQVSIQMITSNITIVMDLAV
jgi:hypothetical protein